MTVMDACGKAGALCAFAAAMCWLKVACNAHKGRYRRASWSKWAAILVVSQFSNRGLCVKRFCKPLVCRASAGSWFSPRSAHAAA
jgi:hypothetical protein